MVKTKHQSNRIGVIKWPFPSPKQKRNQALISSLSFSLPVKVTATLLPMSESISGINKLHMIPRPPKANEVKNTVLYASMYAKR
jgi:hypothetical protein